MSKIICDICGTTYPDTAENCPICGCSRDAAADFLGAEFLTEELADDAKAKGGRFTTKKKEIFDFDEVNTEIDEDEVSGEVNPYEEEEEYEEESRGSNVFVIILLTLLIVALLGAAGFLFVRYILPNMSEEETVPPTTAAVVEETEAPTTEANVPCQMLILTSGTAELKEEGQYFLLHVQATPEDTTDEIIFASADESIATVSEDGRITAVSEGETVIFITCGNIQTTCPVVIAYEEETVPVEETVDETVDETGEAADPGIRTDVTLKLKQNDFRLAVYYEHQLLLDCDLEQNEVTWTSEHPHIATVDENGVVKAVKSGTTSIIAKYGDQEVSCMVRCF